MSKNAAAPAIPPPLEQCRVLQACSQQGKQAIKKEHRELLPQNIEHSTDFEAAATQWKAKQTLKRWDYLVRSKRLNGWAAIEVHQAKASDLIEKKRDSQTILQTHCPPMLSAIKAWRACIKGEIHHTQRRQLSETGIQISRTLLDVL